jgi:release factor glutamine methyltransferase
VSTLGALVREAAARLEVAGCESPRLDAELLVAHAVGVPRTAVFTEPMRSVDPAAVEPLVVRRERREPVAYILGTKPFRNLELAVSPAVLIPRPETEHLVEAALGLPPGARVCDVGTGSGAVALALKQERPDLRVVATDSSAEALAVARENARFHDLDVEFLRGDLLGPVEGHVDAVVSNPPYVADPDRADLPPDVAAYEPPAALFGGPDGLDVLRRLVGEAAGRDARFVAFEVAAGQSSLIAQLLRNAGYAQVEARQDLAGIERVVIAWR